MQRRQKVEAQLQRAKTGLEERRGALDALGKRLKQERKDVEKLEGLSLTALFHTFLSSKKEQLQKERQEVLQAKLKYDECHAATGKLQASIVDLEGKLEDKQALDAAYATVMAKKEKVLLQEGSGRARRLIALAEEIADTRSKLQELQEALAAGDVASTSLDLVVDSLTSARGWGTFDMLGGGLLATAVKHSHIDKARNFAHDAQADLFDLQNELADIEIQHEISIEISGFNRFADYLLDGLIFDWVVQSKIHRSLAEAQDTQLRVDKILAYLDAEAETTAKRVKELEAERERVIEGA